MPKPLSTLHVDLGREWRGGQSQALLLARGLLAEGQVAEMAAVEGSPLAERARAAGVRVHAVGRALAPLAIRGLLGGARFDLVHCHDAHGLTAAWLAGAARRVPLVASRRVAYPLARNALARRRYQAAARIVAVSEFVKHSVVASGVPAAKVEVVYDGVELPVLAPGRERGGPPLLGCVGYLLPEKGQELLIRALPLLLDRRPDCRLLLAGAGPCRAALERLAGQLGVAGAVRFAGFVDDIDGVYRSLDVFLFPSLAEPLGSALLSAMAYGLPVVAAARGAVPEVIEDGRDGLLVPELAPEAFAAAVLPLLDDPALAARLGAAARQTVDSRFSADAMTRGTLQVYHRVLAC